MSTFTTIAELQRLSDRELNILVRSVTERLAGYAEGKPESLSNARSDPLRDRAAAGAQAEAGLLSDPLIAPSVCCYSLLAAGLRGPSIRTISEVGRPALASVFLSEQQPALFLPI